MDRETVQHDGGKTQESVKDAIRLRCTTNTVFCVCPSLSSCELATLKLLSVNALNYSEFLDYCEINVDI